jgi:hypothetical protein
MFKVNGAAMGSVTPATTVRKIHLRGEACDRIERIEVLRDNRVIHFHTPPEAAVTGDQIRTWKLRLEAGWGPKCGEIPLPDRTWTGSLNLASGRFLNWQPCWIDGGQKPPRLDGAQASFELISRQAQAAEMFQNGLIFTIEAASSSILSVELNGKSESLPLATLADSSRLIAYERESRQLITEVTGCPSETFPRISMPFAFAYKCRLHRLVPESEYHFDFSFEDEDAGALPCYYRSRVIQRNGQRAWSSPVWVGGEGEGTGGSERKE